MNHDRYGNVCLLCDEDSVDGGSEFCDVHEPTPERVAAMKEEIANEDRRRLEYIRSKENKKQIAENNRRASLPSEHKDHIHGMRCDGQDGESSYCTRLRRKLFGGTA